MPALDIAAENFGFFGKKRGQMERVAHYVRAASGREWRIRKLALRNPDASLSASGKWVTMGVRNTTSLDYKLDINDAGKLLNRFGFDNVLRAGKGRSEEHTSELQSLMRISYAIFCLTTKKNKRTS